MQHRYVGDVGDFGKYALLNALACSGLRLGVIWYLNEFEEDNADGNFIYFGHLESLDSQLYKRLGQIRETKRHLSQIHSGGVLPADTLFFDGVLPRPDAPCYSQRQREPEKRRREAWFGKANEAMSTAQLVFLDPDNGIEPSGLAMHSTRACKYAFESEVRRLIASGKSVIVYQHQNRNGTLEQQVGRAMMRFADVSKRTFAITFHAYAVRAYIVLTGNSTHKRLLNDCCIPFLKKGWNQVFRMVDTIQT